MKFSGYEYFKYFFMQKKGIKVLGQLMEKYQKFEYIGLAKNGIQNLENLKDIFNAIGKKVLNQEELAFYREKEKEKEQIIQKATKNKKRITEDMYPHLDPIVQLPDGCISLIEFYLEQFAIVRNTQIKMLNLSMNNINEAESEQLEKFLVNVTEDLQIVLYHNNFEGKHKERLKKKYRKNIQI